MRVGDGFPALPALKERVHHVADDRARANDRDLHYDVVKPFRPQAGQTRHLRAAFYLEHSNGVGFLKRGVHVGIISGQMREIHFFMVVIADEFDRVFQNSHHTEAEQIDFYDTHVGTIFFVPLHDDTAWHGSRFEWDDGIETSLADDHAARMLAEVAR